MNNEENKYKQYGPGTTVIKTKDGKEYIGQIWTWRPEDNFVILQGEPKISFDDIESAFTYGQRVSINSPPEGETQDELERARDDLRRGREHNWYNKSIPIYNWEKNEYVNNV